jgi:PIN domain nuclease of toxin-antitoxin system
VKILLDTHVFIWINGSPEKVSQKAMALLLDVGNTLMLSMASVWEMQIKIQLGKIQLNAPLSELLATQQQINNLQILPIELEHILALAGLPDSHRDPFDRLLIAQAVVTQMPIVSVDAVFDSYPVQRLW